MYFRVSTVFIFNLFISTAFSQRNCGFASVSCPCGKTGSTITVPAVKDCATAGGLCKPCESESSICSTFANCLECSPQIRNRCSLCPQARGGMRCDEILGCQTLMQPPNGDVHPFGQSPYGFQEGEQVRYSCYDGFSLTAGNLTRTCRKDGSWTGVEPICVPNNGREPIKPITEPPTPVIAHPEKKCSTPTRVQNSRVILEENSVTYICDPGFTLVGHMKITCENGEWMRLTPTCISKDYKMCPAVEPVQTARVEVIHKNSSKTQRTEAESSDKLLGPFPEGTQLTYRCESNFYQQVGPKIRTCKNGQWSGRPPMCNPICGRSNKPRTPLIKNGSPSEIGQWPWAVVIRRHEGGKWDFKCGGSLITERMILTAAHCVTKRGLTDTFPTESFRLYAGKHFLDDALDDREVQIRKATEVLVHPNYNPFSLDSDVSLIGVAESFTLTIRVQTVCLPEPSGIDFRSGNGNLGTVIGWGVTEKKEAAFALTNLEVPLVSTDKCREEYRKKGITVTDNMICAGFDEGGRDACSGDSGGPLMLPLDRNGQKWVQEGIVSWGGTLESDCAEPGEYGSYVKVRNYVDWINQFMFSK